MNNFFDPVQSHHVVILWFAHQMVVNNHGLFALLLFELYPCFTAKVVWHGRKENKECQHFTNFLVIIYQLLKVVIGLLYILSSSHTFQEEFLSLFQYEELTLSDILKLLGNIDRSLTLDREACDGKSNVQVPHKTHKHHEVVLNKFMN